MFTEQWRFWQYWTQMAMGRIRIRGVINRQQALHTLVVYKCWAVSQRMIPWGPCSSHLTDACHHHQHKALSADLCVICSMMQGRKHYFSEQSSPRSLHKLTLYHTFYHTHIKYSIHDGKTFTCFWSMIYEINRIHRLSSYILNASMYPFSFLIFYIFFLDCIREISAQHLNSVAPVRTPMCVCVYIYQNHICVK